MKSYFKNYDELAVAWVNGDCTPDAHTAKNRMYVEGNVILSYGRHFVIARKFRAPDTGRLWYLLTDRDYSPTTQTHIKSVRSAIPSGQRVHLPQVDDLMHINSEADLAREVLQYECDKLVDYAKSYLRMTRPWAEPAERFHSTLAYLQRFDLRLPATVLDLIPKLEEHKQRRDERNAYLDSTLEARRRLVTA